MDELIYLFGCSTDGHTLFDIYGLLDILILIEQLSLGERR